MNHFKKIFNQLNPDVVSDIESSFKIWNTKNNVLVRKGRTTDNLFFINNGYAFIKIEMNKKQWVRHIAQSGEFITSLSGLEKGNYSQETIVAIGECEILYIDKCTLMKLRSKYSQVDGIYNQYIKNALLACQKRIGELLSLEAEEYYERLLVEKSSIMLNVPQYELASYLGIQPQSLSRIRGKVRRIS